MKTDFEKPKNIMVDIAEISLKIVGGLVGLALLIVLPVALIYGFVAGLIYVVVKVLQMMGVL